MIYRQCDITEIEERFKLELEILRKQHQDVEQDDWEPHARLLELFISDVEISLQKQIGVFFNLPYFGFVKEDTRHPLDEFPNITANNYFESVFRVIFHLQDFIILVEIPNYHLGMIHCYFKNKQGHIINLDGNYQFYLTQIVNHLRQDQWNTSDARKRDFTLTSTNRQSLAPQPYLFDMQLKMNLPEHPMLYPKMAAEMKKSFAELKFKLDIVINELIIKRKNPIERKDLVDKINQTDYTYKSFSDDYYEKKIQHLSTYFREYNKPLFPNHNLHETIIKELKTIQRGE